MVMRDAEMIVMISNNDKVKCFIDVL
jgi:hypothetical protein